VQFVIFILIGLLAGWVAEQVMKRDDSILVNLGVGIVGALIGGTLATLLQLRVVGILGELVVATAGAILFLWLLGLIRRR